TELYDARARMWSPALGSFLSVDEFNFHNHTTTLWGWPGQNPVRYADKDGHGWLIGIVAIVAVGVAYGYLFASDDAATNRAAHPELENNPAGQIAASVGVLAPIGALAEVGAAGQAGGLAAAVPPVAKDAA